MPKPLCRHIGRRRDIGVDRRRCQLKRASMRAGGKRRGAARPILLPLGGEHR